MNAAQRVTGGENNSHKSFFPFCLFLPLQGSLPLPWDVSHLVKEYKIGAVVNVTIEFSGPLEAHTLLPFLPPSLPPQGSLPLPWDVPHLVKEYNIGAVVNMTIEYSGPLEQYALHGVKQLHLPTVDTAAPTLEQVRLYFNFYLFIYIFFLNLFIYCLFINQEFHLIHRFIKA